MREEEEEMKVYEGKWMLMDEGKCMRYNEGKYGLSETRWRM